MKKVTIIGLLATLIVIFMFQGETIVSKPVDVVLIMVPLIIQTYLIFSIGFVVAKTHKVKYNLAAPATMIGASNFFELSIATVVILFGLGSSATLATVVGVLVEIPVMLSLVNIVKKKCYLFEECNLNLPQCKISSGDVNLQ